MLDFEALGLSSTYTRRLVTVGLVREPGLEPGHRLKSAAELYANLRPLADLDREVFVAIHIDHKTRMVGVHVISLGSIAASLVHPREVFKAAILTNAHALIVVHNHPSGDPTPSREDREITERLKSSGDILGIPLFDHVVIATDGFRSFADAGML